MEMQQKLDIIKSEEALKQLEQLNTPKTTKKPNAVKKFFRTMGSSFGIVGELFGFLWAQKLWWLMPMVLVLVSLALLMIFASASGIGPFIYTLF